MINTEMIVSAITGQTGNEFEQVCCLCGGSRSIKGFSDRDKVLSGHFTDYNLMKSKLSDVICDFCRLALSDDLLESPRGKRCGLRLYSFLVEKNKFRIIGRSEKIFYLFDYCLSSPFILAFSNSGKKHISYKSIINYVYNPFKSSFWVSCENCNILFDRQKWLPYYEVMQEFFDRGVFKSELLSCLIPPWKFEKYKLDMLHFQQLKKVKRTAQYQLIINSLMKKDKED